MRKINKYNEELDPQTYRNAANRLRKRGHVRRVKDLESWSMESSKRDLINGVSSIGTFEIEIKSSRGGGKREYTGEFYLDIHIDTKLLINQFKNFQNDDDVKTAHLKLDIFIIPTSDDYYDKMNNGMIKEGGIKLSIVYLSFGEKVDGSFYPKIIDNDILRTICNFENELGSSSYNFVDRRNANKFRKALIDIFSGDVVYKKTNDYPMGLKQELFDILLAENDFMEIEPFEDWVNNLKRMNINSLYKD